MQCPVDGSTLLMTVRETVEIDYCPQCRGIWLDRGELDKLIERSGVDDDDRARPRERDREPERRDYDSRRDHDDRYPRKPKKKWLSEMFDFD